MSSTTTSDRATWTSGASTAGTTPDHNGGIYFYDNPRDEPPGPTRDLITAGPRFAVSCATTPCTGWTSIDLDGLRFDATAYIRNVEGNNDDAWNDLPDGWSLMQWINDEVKASQPWKITIGEDLRHNEWITRDTGGGGAGFGAQWDGEFVHPIRGALITARRCRPRHRRRRAGPSGSGSDGDALERVIYTESHDEVANGKQRVPSEIWTGQRRQLVLEEALDPRRRAGIHRARHPHDLPGTGIPRRRVVPRHRSARLAQGRDFMRDPPTVPRPHPAAPELVQPHPRPARAARPCPPREPRRQGDCLPSLGSGRTRRRRGRGAQLRQPRL